MGIPLPIPSAQSLRIENWNFLSKICSKAARKQVQIAPQNYISKELPHWATNISPNPPENIATTSSRFASRTASWNMSKVQLRFCIYVPLNISDKWFSRVKSRLMSIFPVHLSKWINTAMNWTKSATISTKLPDNWTAENRLIKKPWIASKVFNKWYGNSRSNFMTCLEGTADWRF